MKMLKIVLTVVFIILLLVVSWFALIIYLFGNRACPDFKDPYSVWFPYEIGDTLVFEKGIKIKKMLVETYTIDYNSSYSPIAKCGCCEDAMILKIKDTTDFMYFIWENQENRGTCLGKSFSYNNVTIIDNQKEAIRDTLINNHTFSQIYVKNELLLIQKKGIIQANIKGKMWKMKQVIHKKKGINRTVSAGC